MNLKGKVALLTGGARMGLALGQELAKRGCAVVFTWKNSRRAAEEAGFAIHADLEKEKDVKNLAQVLQKKYRGLDILIHMASRYEKLPLPHLRWKIWQKSMTSELGSAFLTAQTVIPLMKKRPSGRILFISDWIAASGRPRYRDYLPYYVAKRALLGLAECLALELSPRILVNCIAPGPILPPPGMSLKENAQVMRQTPLRRWGGPGEIAKAALFLLETDFVTGECLRVDGGRHLF